MEPTKKPEVSSTPEAPKKFEVIAKLRRQLDDLEWLLTESKVDPDEWELTFDGFDDEVTDVPTFAVRLNWKHNRTVVISTVVPLEIADDGERHFFINGNHHYGEFAILDEELQPGEVMPQPGEALSDEEGPVL